MSRGPLRIGHKKGKTAKLRRYAKQFVRMVSERMNRGPRWKLPLEPIGGWPVPSQPKPRKSHRDRM